MTICVKKCKLLPPSLSLVFFQAFSIMIIVAHFTWEYCSINRNDTVKHFISRFKQWLARYFFEPRFHFSRLQFNLVSVFFVGLGIVIGLYFTAFHLIPTIFAVNDTSKTWTFNTANAGNYTYDNTLVAVDNSGARPITGANKFTNPAFASDNTSWATASAAPAGWVEVPGNSTFSTTNFLAMKYDAKCAANATPTVGLTSPDTGYHTYANNTTACTSANSRQVVSVASGYPIANINHTDAASYCGNVSVGGSTAHLIRNDEWQTIAQNAEGQNTNWSGGSVGSGYLYAGHNDNSPATALPASTTDTGNYRCAYTDSGGSTEAPSPCPSNTGSGQSGSTGNQVRTLSLSNGAVIWDIAGNVWEHVARSTNNSGDDTSTMTTLPACSNNSAGWEWCQYGGSTSPYVSAWTSAVPQANVAPSHSTYDSNSGVGQVYTYGTGAGQSTSVFLRGGTGVDTSDTGAFALNLSWTTTTTYYSVGFRCASDPVAISQSWSSSSGRGGSGGDTVSVGSVSDGLLTESINVGDTSTYDFSAYVYDNTAGNVGGTVSSSIAQLYANGSTVTTTYTSVGSGWYKLSGSVTGVASSVTYGLLVKSGKTVKVDDFTLSKQGTYSVYTTSAYSNAQVVTWDSFCEGTITGGTCSNDGVTASGNASVGYQICTDNGSSCGYSSGSRWQYYTGGAWTNAADATQTNTAAQLTQAAMQALSTTSQKISVKAVMGFGGADTPAITNLSVGLTTDTTPPTTNASSILAYISNGGSSLSSGGWTNGSSPYFSWTAGADNAGGSGLKGYCLYLGTDSAGDPATAKGLLGTSPVSTTGTTCQFIVAGTSIDLATSSYQGSTWLSSSSSPYYLNIKAVDNGGNIYGGSSAAFSFYFDNTGPTNVSYISCASGNFSNVTDMSFNWPTSGSAASSDSNSGVLGWQYQINSSSGSWQGTTHSSSLNLDYIPATASAYTLVSSRDSGAINTGSNVIYFRTVDSAGNLSSGSTIRTCSLSYGGAAPTFGSTDVVTVTPSTSTTNSYALSWPAATPTSGKTIAHYYYMVNVSPPSTLATLQGTATTYIDNGTSLTVAATSLANATKGTNTVYVVAIDNASTPNYSPSNYITGTFTLNSTNPDPVQSLVASDSSIKDKSQWNVTLTWAAPSYQGAGNLTYKVYRSTDDSTFSYVGSTSGLSYIDNTPSSTLYYYYVVTVDGASAVSSNSTTVSLTPTGKYTTAPTLSSGPSAGSITTKKATITWSTSRNGDSRVAYGTTSGSYGSVEAANSDQVTSHSIDLSGLTSGTTYYYKAKWTDGDGNQGTSDEKSFTTTSAPTVSAVSAGSIGLTSAYISFTIYNGSKATVQYGLTTSYGGSTSVSTSNTGSGATYSVPLTGLTDGSPYHYRIVMEDADGNQYNSDDYTDLVTLPRPKVTTVRLAQVENTAQTTILVTWTTNTDISSIVTYWPQGNSGAAKDEVNVALTTGEHQMIIRGLEPQTDYMLVVKGRDKLGNEATSDSQRFTTATDTRPPQLLELAVQGETIPPVAGTAQHSIAQLIVSWNTDKPGTSQVEFSEGTGTTYSQKTQEDSNLTMNHLVVISGLTPSQVYHLRAISVDKYGNIGNSIDTVTIAPKATDNALNLVITSLGEAFGFLGGLGK